MNRKAKRLVILLAILVTTPVAARADAPARAATKPTHVTVYPNGARVQREGSLELKEGPHAVLFPDLPASLLESSLRLSVDGPKGTRYFGVALKKQFTDTVVDARTRKLRNQIQKLQDRKTDLRDKIEARQSEINILKSYGTHRGNGGKQPPINIKDFTQSASTIAERIATLTAANRKDERAVRNLDLKINALNSELAQGSSSARERRTAQADLELKQAGTVRFKLTYQVHGASWSPTYDLNLDTKGEKPELEFGFNGNIRQSTGENWKGVTVTLSTSRPTEATQVPDPTNWWINYYAVQAQIYRRSHGMYPSSAAAPSAAMEEDRATAKKMAQGRAADLEPAQLELAKTVQAAFAANYSVTVPKDIPSDGSEHRIGILQSQYPVELSTVVVPRLSLAAFVEATVNYSGEQVLLPGPAQLFRDGDFTGTTNLVAKAPGETFELGFGQDDLIRVERKKGEDVKSSKSEHRYHWITTAANFHPNGRIVEVREQLPRTQSREIAVERTEVNPEPLPENPEKPGLLVWKLDVKPKEKATITFAYRVEHPEGANLSGLE